MKTTEFQIGGMTCPNCESVIERVAGELPGIQTVQADYRTGTAVIVYDEGQLAFSNIQSAIEAHGYTAELGETGKRMDFRTTAGFLVVILSLYVILEQFGILNRLVPGTLADRGMGYGMLFVTGLLTSIHCVAMCGGINLSQSLPSEDASKGLSLRPALLYNLGRVLSYTAAGAALGLIGFLLGGGSGLGIPALLQGILKLIAGTFMVSSGVNLLGLFPWLRTLQLRLPKSLRIGLGKARVGAKTPLLIGLLNGLMPCGPLQSMQILALASGSPLTGGLSMLAFSLGTVPLMLGLGSAVSLLGKRFAKAVTTVGAILVIVLGLSMLSQGGSLSGLVPPDRLMVLVVGLAVLALVGSVSFWQRTAKRIAITGLAVIVLITAVWLPSFGGAGGGKAHIENGVQYVTSTLEAGKYPEITVQAGLPVQWTIDAPAGTVNGCNYRMLLQNFGIAYDLSEGENRIEFTPEEAGTFSYSCWMGMIHGTIHVTEGS